MTVSKAIIKWLEGFNSEYNSLAKINTDIQGPKVDTFALVKEPVKNVKSYISGKKVYTEHYMIQARLASGDDLDRVDNLDFGEALEEYVKSKDKAEEYPVIPDATVKSIEVTTPFYLGVAGDNSSVYQMTIAIKYEKEN